MRCTSCGAEIPEGMSVCLECGAIPDNTVVSHDTNTQEWREKQKANINMATPGWMTGPLTWFTRFQGLQLILYAFQMLIALTLFYYLGHPRLLFSQSGADFFDFVEKAAKNMKWIQIVITIVCMITLYIMSSYGEGFWQAGLIGTVLLVVQLLTDDLTVQSYRLLADGAAIILEILYAIVLFKQLQRFTEPFDSSVSARWDRLLTLWIYAYIASAAVSVYLIFFVKTLKEAQFCTAVLYLLIFAIGLPVYNNLKRTVTVVR